jgi:hypothetical protein
MYSVSLFYNQKEQEQERGNGKSERCADQKERERANDRKDGQKGKEQTTEKMDSKRKSERCKTRETWEY